MRAVEGEEGKPWGGTNSEADWFVVSEERDGSRVERSTGRKKSISERKKKYSCVHEERKPAGHRECMHTPVPVCSHMRGGHTGTGRRRGRGRTERRPVDQKWASFDQTARGCSRSLVGERDTSHEEETLLVTAT